MSGATGWSSRPTSSITVCTFSGRPTTSRALGFTTGVMLTLPCRGQVDLVVQRADQPAHRLAIDVPQRQHLDGRLGLGAELLDLVDDLHHLLDVLACAADHQHVEPLEHFDLHRIDQSRGLSLFAWLGRHGGGTPGAAGTPGSAGGTAGTAGFGTGGFGTGGTAAASAWSLG